MSRNEALDKIVHGDIRIITERSAQYGDDISLVAAVPSEFKRLAAHYPLFFRKEGDTEEFSTIALLGLWEGENLFLSDEGWDTNYIPLGIRRHPFRIGFQENPQDSTQVGAPVLYVDMEHPRVQSERGEPCFLEDGSPSPFLEKVNSVLFDMMNGVAAMKLFSARMLELELIEPVRMEINLKDGSTHVLEGLYTVPEPKLRELAAEHIVEFHQSGMLMLAYTMIISVAQIQGMVDRKNALLEV